MLKDLSAKKLSEKQLDNVQGGEFMGVENVRISCLYPGCNWAFQGTKDAGMAAKQEHTNATGHQEFAMAMAAPGNYI